MCDEWRDDFGAFLRDIGPRPSADHSIDRIDNNGPYSPENCRWVTLDVQSRNKRTNVMLTLNGETMCRGDWAKRLGVSPYTIKARLKHGWPLEEALTRPRLHSAAER